MVILPNVESPSESVGHRLRSGKTSGRRIRVVMKDDGAAPLPARFGAFIAPYHDVAGNPTLQLRRDIELAVLLDELGFDEVWFGEHHSGAYEMSASPEVMIAAAGERTRRIMLGTG